MTKSNYLILMHTDVYEGQTLERALCGIHKAGFENIELACIYGYAEHVVPEGMKEEDYKRLDRLLDEFGVRVASISAHVPIIERKPANLGENVEWKMIGLDKAWELWKNRIDLAARLGTTIVNTSVGELETKEDYDTFYKYIGMVEDYCSGKGIRVALENDSPMMGKEFRPIMEKLNSKWIGINYDTANGRYYRNVQAEDDIENVMDWIFNIHMKDHIGGKGDYNFPAVGDGEVHFHQIFRILEKHDWKGPVSAEIEYEGPGLKRPPEMIDTDVKRSFNFITRLAERY